MASKPLFVATHPRACSTAFERVFMSRDDLKCIHEPFGDAFYFGPERLGTRYEDDEQARIDSGFSTSTYKSVFDSIMAAQQEGKQLVIKDIAHYLQPPQGKSAVIAPSLRASATRDESGQQHIKHDSLDPSDSDESEPGNPTVIPKALLQRFNYAFLIRHPRHSIPSYWRCTIPPLSEETGFRSFMPAEAGYREQRRFLDYTRQQGLVSQQNVCVIDADDLLDDPKGIMYSFCRAVGVDFQPEMLVWDTDEQHDHAKVAFEKWTGFHTDAINSTGLHARRHKKADQSIEDDYSDWVGKYGEAAAKVIRDTVERNLADYFYMKQFAITA